MRAGEQQMVEWASFSSPAGQSMLISGNWLDRFSPERMMSSCLNCATACCGEVSQVFPPFEDNAMAAAIRGVGLHDEIFLSTGSL